MCCGCYGVRRSLAEPRVMTSFLLSPNVSFGLPPTCPYSQYLFLSSNNDHAELHDTLFSSHNIENVALTTTWAPVSPNPALRPAEQTHPYPSRPASLPTLVPASTVGPSSLQRQLSPWPSCSSSTHAPAFAPPKPMRSAIEMQTRAAEA